MKKNMTLAVRWSSVVLAGSLVALAESRPTVDLRSFDARLRQARVIEQPLVLAQAISEAPKASRSQAASDLLGAALRASPASSTKLLSAAIRAVPGAAVSLTEVAVRLQPENAAALVSVAMDASPADRDSLAALLDDSTGVGGRLVAQASTGAASSKSATGAVLKSKGKPPGGGGPPGQNGGQPSGNNGNGTGGGKGGTNPGKGNK